MMIDLIQGPSQSVLSDGSHPLLGQAFNVHEESGHRSACSRTAYKVMTVDTTSSAPAPSVHHGNLCPTTSPDHPSLAPCSGRQGRYAPPHGGGLRPALTALARGAPQLQRSGRKDGPFGRTKGCHHQPLDYSSPI